MTSIILWSILAVALASTGLALLIVGYRRRAARLLIPGVLSLMASTVCAGVVVVKAAQRAVHHAQDALAPRPGAEIYAALFGKPGSCVQVIDAQDQIIPKLDPVIRLHVNTCPTEVWRVLRQYRYELKVEATNKDTRDRFSPRTFGDSVLTFTTTIVEGRNWRTLIIARDSTRMIVVDAAD
ncbi:MAG: hypothetical protein IPM49_09290 [Flavobacteriales bacterium]|nr:hypothetical protein [Flavobacteriales bacterium]